MFCFYDYWRVLELNRTQSPVSVYSFSRQTFLLIGVQLSVSIFVLIFLFHVVLCIISMHSSQQLISGLDDSVEGDSIL